MKITLHMDGEGGQDPRTLECRLPFDGADYVLVQGDGVTACPSCHGSPFKVQGIGDPARGHDTYSSRAACPGCHAVVGQIVVKMSTIFGCEEDEAVLHGRPRVY